ncbi:MAG: alpha/beta fold hydrolase [Luteibaculaceae bacterium]
MENLLHYKVYANENANAPWVVFVHGAGGSTSTWFKQLRDFKEEFNLLMLDLRGHGLSKGHPDYEKMKGYTLEDVCIDIIQVLDHLNIQKAHFVGMSLGTIILRLLGEKIPNRIQSLIMGGAIIRFNLRSKLLLFSARMLQRIVPFIWLYKIYAYVLMPKKNHSESRNIFIREAKKLYQKEFLRWMKITSQLNRIFKIFYEKELSIPTLYISGSEDHMFLGSVKNLVEKQKLAVLKIIDGSGHVCNIDAPKAFNQHSIHFIRETSRISA